LIGKYKNCPIPLPPYEPSIGVMLFDRLERWPDHGMVATRSSDGPYRPVSWGRAMGDIAATAVFLRQLGVEPGDRVAVFSPNSYAMLVWELAVVSMGSVSVPIFADYDEKRLEFILRHSQPKTILAGGEERREKVAACPSARGLARIVTAEELAGGIWSSAEDAVGTLAGMVRRVQRDDICFIQYTSGTTGDPKGVMLMHRNILSQQAALSRVWDISSASRFLSYLPWHHSFGGLFERFSALYNGATLYLEDSFGKDIDRLFQNWAAVKPTQFFSVPKIYTAMMTEARLNPEIKEVLFHPGLKFVFTAAAPLPRECGEYFKVQGIPVLEGWGLTETSPCVTLTPAGKERVHSIVGEPIPGCEVVTTEDGEILVRGPNVMQGYYRDPERTERAIDSYGWFHTGDLGEITDYGVRMICRQDGLFKLSNGRKVSSMLVENALTLSSRWIQHAVALGSGEDYVAALVFPNYRNLRHWAESEGILLPEGEALSGHPKIQALIADEVEENLLDFQPKYAQVQAFVIVPHELTIEAGELTPSMKVIRHRVSEKFKEWSSVIYQPSLHEEKQCCVVRLQGGEYAFTW